MNQIKLLLTLVVLSFCFVSGHAQNMVDAGANQTIYCNGSVQLNATPMNGWTTLNNAGIVYGLNSVFFTSEQTGFTVGGFGMLYKTTDGGNNWSPQAMLSTGSLNSVYFINSTTGFVAGGSGLIQKTTDGGNTWIQQTSKTTSSLGSICFTSPLVGYMAGSRTILKTTDGGTTWTPYSLDATTYINSICFSSPDTGYAAGVGGVLLKTTDAGTTWVPQITGQTAEFYSIAFTSATTGYIVGTGGTILKTTDGINWSKYTAGKIFMEEGGSISTTNSRPLASAILLSVCFPTATTGYCAGYYQKNSIFMKTLDGGATWFEQPSNAGSKITSLCFPTQNVGYASGGGNLLKLTNGELKPMVYSWNPTEGLSNSTIANPVASPTQNTLYTVTASIPDNGYTGYQSFTDTVKVTLGTFLVTPAANKTIGCEGSVRLDSVKTNFSGSGRVTYKWVPSTGLSSDTIINPVASVTSLTTYTVTASTPGGCQATGQVNVSVVPLTVTATVDKTVVCSGAAQLASTTNYSGTKAVHYKWTPATGLSNDTLASPVATVSSQTVYSVTASTVTGCSAVGNVTVRVSGLTANAGADKTVQCGETAQLDGVTTNYNGTGRLRYKWTPLAGLSSDTIVNPKATVSANTTYTVTVTAFSGCTATDNVLVSVIPITVNVGADKSAACGVPVQLSVTSTNYTGTGLKYKWTPATGLNNDTLASPVAMAGNITYTLTVTTPTGCTASDNVAITGISLDKPALSYIGINGKNKNVLVWTKPTSGKINSFNVYKETNVSNSYTKVGSVPIDSASVFVDQSSNPDVQSNKYKLSVLDACGNESALSDYHKTMHLSINKGINTIWNLIWEAYEGYTVSTYNIYRGTTPDKIQIIGSLSGSNTQFSDYTAPAGYVYYQIEAVSTGTSGVKQEVKSNVLSTVETVAFTSRSNIATNKSGMDGLNELKDISDLLSIYPNPATSTIQVKVGQSGVNDLKICIYNAMGVPVLTEETLQNEPEMNISNLTNGIYLLQVKTDKYVGIQKLIIQK